MAGHRFYSFTINNRIYSAEETQKNIFHIIHVNQQGQPMETGETGIARLEQGHDEWFWGEENISASDKHEIISKLTLATRENHLP
jgi:hypothetical protein